MKRTLAGVEQAWRAIERGCSGGAVYRLVLVMRLSGGVQGVGWLTARAEEGGRG